MKFFKNRFLFIMLISLVTLGALVLGAITLYEKEELVFASDGYIIEASNKTNTKYYFSANTQYKENVDKKIVFSDVDDKKVSVDPASFVHYSNGDVTFLKKGALVNLMELSSSLINYYNITNESTIKYNNGSYKVSSNGKDIDINAFIGRISDNKYLISGSDLKLKIPQNPDILDGEYFEVLFIEDGIVKIDNEKASYQVTAQDTYIYIGANITINLGNGKISYDGDVKMLMSQITISGNENIDLDVDEKDLASAGGGGGGGGSGSGTGEGDGDGTGSGSGEDGAGGTGEGTGTGEGGSGGTGEGTGEGTDGEGTGNGDGTGTGNGTGSDGNGGTGSSGGDGEGVKVTASLQVELIEAITTSTTIDLSLQLNNTELVDGKLLYYFTNLSTGKREGNSEYIDLVNGTFKVEQESFSPSTDYSFTIVGTDGDNETQYFQKTFRTKDLGIVLEKNYATDNSLSYNLKFDENSEVSKAQITIKSSDPKEEIKNNQIIVSSSDIGGEVIFEKLKSNTTYAVSVDVVWINNAAYSNVYSINRLDTTLKKTPTIKDVVVTANSEEVKFDIKLKTVKDTDKSIEKYIYNIYLADDITSENLDPQVVYSVTKSDSDDLLLNLNEINELKTGVNYRCKIFAQYNDNEMVREVSTEYSGNFLIKSKPNITFELESTTMNSVIGTLKLLDANCTVPFIGRSCANKNNKFTLRYYKLTEDEHKDNDKEITFDSSLSTKLEFVDLESNTTYAVKVFGSYYDDDNVLHPDVQIGDTLFITTDKSPNIYFEVVGDNESSGNEIVSFDAHLSAPKDSDVINQIGTMTLNLYNGRSTAKDRLIGTYVVTERGKIEDFFNNVTITNSLFTDVTGMNVGQINTLRKLIKVTNNLTGTLNSAYTVEITDVYDSTGLNEIKVENPIYIFNLTNSYYLDSRIESNMNQSYVTVTPITRENLTEEEYEELSKDVEELDQLHDDTVVGLTIENNLSDTFVNSAFTYKNVVVDYIICNQATKDCDTIINSIVELSNKLNKEENEELRNQIDELKQSVKIISVDMDNQYLPKEQVVWLDSITLDDGDKYVTRGYTYKIGYNLNFELGTEEADVTYTHSKLYTSIDDKLQQNVSIERQKPDYIQYIYDSNDQGISYRYKISDIDKAIVDNNFYYRLGESEDYKRINKSLVADNKEHVVTIPISNNSKYSLYYAMKNTSNKISYVSISDYMFEKEYKYDNRITYSIMDDSTNVLKIKLDNNDYTSRAYAYRVNIKAQGVDTYTRYFLASKLNTLQEETDTYDESGNEIVKDIKYIGIDFANIIDFMNHEMTIEVFCYYDSGKVGINQKFDYGLILKNNANKYLNTYHQGKDKDKYNDPTSNEDEVAMGIYHVTNEFSVGNREIFIYNHLVYRPNNFDGSAVGIESERNNSDFNLNYYGINYAIDYTDKGIIFSNGSRKYEGYNFRVLNGVDLVTDNNKYKFDTIIPSVKVVESNASNSPAYNVDSVSDNTINSIRLKLVPSGIYGNKQFVKDGKTHNKVYVDFYNSSEIVEENKINTIVSNVNISSTGSGYSANIDDIIYENLKADTTYYFTVSAYINDVYTRLFDSNVIEYQKKYVSLDYQASTLGVKTLLNSFTFSVSPTSYNGKYSMNTLSWTLNLKSTENFGLRYELFRPDGTSTEVNPDTLEEVVTTNYKEVNFNGTDASSCNKDINSSSNNSSSGYVDGCYIKVKEDKISAINAKSNKYQFSNEHFVFGGNYYKLVVYAVPYYDGKYNEDDKLVLYQNDSLTSYDGDKYRIIIPTLKEASFKLDPQDGLVTGVGDNGYYISVEPVVDASLDPYKVMSDGIYTVILKDDDGQVVGSISSSSVVNKQFRFDGLKSNSYYDIEIVYDTYYENNVAIKDKRVVTAFTTFTYTPVNSNITLGSITARYVSGKSITLTYNGASNINKKIGQIKYTIKENGTNNAVNGWFNVDEGKNIFTVASDKLPRLNIDVSVDSDNTGFTFKSGKTYIITTEYWYYDNGELVELKDLSGKTKFTTILNA